MKKLLLAALCLFFLISGCTMPETKIYNLSLPSEKEHKGPRTGATVTVLVHGPRYLDQSYIVYRTSPYQLDIARYAKWDESPVESVKAAVRDSLSSLCAVKEVRPVNFISGGVYVLEINLRKFERSENERGLVAVLAFDAVFLSPDGRELYRAALAKEVKLEDRSFLHLAEALSAALSEEMEQLKAGISGVLPEGPQS